MSLELFCLLLGTALTLEIAVFRLAYWHLSNWKNELPKRSASMWR